MEGKPSSIHHSALCTIALLVLVRGGSALRLAAAPRGGLARVALAEHQLDLADDGAVQGEDALDADAEARLAHREGLAHALPPARDADALERLEALLGLRLLDAHVHAHRVARPEVGDVRAQLRLLNI